jgi:hypothetical protein
MTETDEDVRLTHLHAEARAREAIVPAPNVPAPVPDHESQVMAPYVPQPVPAGVTPASGG